MYASSLRDEAKTVCNILGMTEMVRGVECVKRNTVRWYGHVRSRENAGVEHSKERVLEVSTV